MRRILKKTPFEEAVDTGIDYAISLVRENEASYHNVKHTTKVLERTFAILTEVYGSSPSEADTRYIRLGCLAAAFHDVVQRWEESSEVAATPSRRKVGYNEEQSAHLAAGFMQSAVGDAGEPLFTQSDVDLIREAIIVTTPAFDPTNTTVYQPHLKTTSSAIAIALALADLGTAGMDGPEAFASEGNALFWEENPDVLNALRNQSLTEIDKANYRQRMLVWSRFQPNFASGRKALLTTELAGLPPDAGNRVLALFDKFDQSIKVSSNTASSREELAFEDLALAMGYQS